jgi:hypothetical protein
VSEDASGQDVCEAFYRSVVAPAIGAEFPHLPHAAGIMGRGSEVLGYDDAMSTDHDWAARAIVFLPDQVLAERGDELSTKLNARLPADFNGFPTGVQVTSVGRYLKRELDLDITSDWDAYDWISLPEHRLCAITSGRVFHDDIGLVETRERLAYYPRDVWLYLLIAAWWRVHPEANLVGRVGYVGDELGSALIAGEIVDGLMRLSFLIERRYAPYQKWRGTAFSRLAIASTLTPSLMAAVRARNWKEREESLNAAYTIVGAAFNNLQLTPTLKLERVRLWNRPFSVMWADFPAALAKEITDPVVHEVLQRWPAGAIDQIPDILFPSRHRRAVRDLVAGLAA